MESYLWSCILCTIKLGTWFQSDLKYINLNSNIFSIRISIVRPTNTITSSTESSILSLFINMIILNCNTVIQNDWCLHLNLNSEYPTYSICMLIILNDNELSLLIDFFNTGACKWHKFASCKFMLHVNLNSVLWD